MNLRPRLDLIEPFPPSVINSGYLEAGQDMLIVSRVDDIDCILVSRRRVALSDNGAPAYEPFSYSLCMDEWLEARARRSLMPILGLRRVIVAQRNVQEGG